MPGASDVRRSGKPDEANADPHFRFSQFENQTFKIFCVAKTAAEIGRLLQSAGGAREKVAG
jgi:hypothetical protein